MTEDKEDNSDDVRPITGTYAKVAARLCNFPTGYPDLKGSHINFLDNKVRDVIQNMQGPWVDLFGYASRRGDEASNMTLSNNRVKAVMNQISQYATKINFQIRQGVGDTESMGNRTNDDGYYRAVEVYVYAYKPTVPVPPQPAFTLRRIVFRSFSKTDVEKDPPPFGAPSLKDDGINDLLKLGISAMLGNLTEEGFLGSEDEHRISHIPANHRVNKVTIDQQVRYDTTVGGGSITQTATEITYEWGEPRANVTVEKHYQFTWNKRPNAPIIDKKTLSRKDANLSSVITPPDPKQ